MGAVVTATLTGVIGYFVMRAQIRIEFRHKLEADQKAAFLALQNTLKAQADQASKELQGKLTEQADQASKALENTLIVENQKFSYEIARDLIKPWRRWRAPHES